MDMIIKVLNGFGILTTIILLLCSVATEKEPCASSWNGCCPNTQWDSDNETCIECPVGYHWINCSRPCVFPHFGKRCAYNCSCEIRLCDFLIGCSVEKENNNTQSVLRGKSVEGLDNNLTQPVYEMKSIGRKQNLLVTALILLTTVFAVVALAFFVFKIIENYMKREVTA